jgi:hypothetical protein
MNLQLVMVCATVLSLLLGAAAFLFVIWPSIRNAERRAARLEKWMDGAEAKELYRAVRSKVFGFESGHKQPASREAFLREAVPGKEEGGTIQL